MTKDQHSAPSGGIDDAPRQQQQQQQQQQLTEQQAGRSGSGGRGSDSALKHLKTWEQRRAADAEHEPADRPSW